jgi:hypothetical protein
MSIIAAISRYGISGMALVGGAGATCSAALGGAGLSSAAAAVLIAVRIASRQA